MEVFFILANNENGAYFQKYKMHFVCFIFNFFISSLSLLLFCHSLSFSSFPSLSYLFSFLKTKTNYTIVCYAFFEILNFYLWIKNFKKTNKPKTSFLVPGENCKRYKHIKTPFLMVKIEIIFEYRTEIFHWELVWECIKHFKFLHFEVYFFISFSSFPSPNIFLWFVYLQLFMKSNLVKSFLRLLLKYGDRYLN